MDCLVVGAGVVGLAVARAMQMAGHETFLIDRADSFGTETSSRNSEVIHAGIYYEPGSLKAKLCVQGKEWLYAYCADRDVPHRRAGKYIVATTTAEVAKLKVYEANAIANGVHDLAWVDAESFAAIEPEVRAEMALFSPSTGIVDSHALMMAYLHDFQMAGGQFVPRCAFESASVEEGAILVRLGDGTALRD